MKKLLVSWSICAAVVLLLGCSGNQKMAVREKDRVQSIRVVVAGTDSLLQEIAFSYAADGKTIDSVKSRFMGKGRYTDEIAFYTVKGRTGINRVERDGNLYESRLRMNPDSSVASVTGKCVQGDQFVSFSVVCQYDSSRLVREDTWSLEDTDTVTRVEHLYSWHNGNIVRVTVNSFFPEVSYSSVSKRTYNYSARENSCNIDLNACWFAGLYGSNWIEMAVGLTGLQNRCLLDSVQIDTPGYDGTRKLSFVYEEDTRGRIEKVYIHFGVADYVAYITYENEQKPTK